MQLWGELRAYQRSHRQVLIADDGAAGLDALVFSRPLHAEAGIHSATALKLSGAALEPLIESEFVLAQFSGWSDGGAMQARAQRLLEPQRRLVLPDGGDAARARVLTEGAIGAALVARIDAAGRGDHVAIAAMFLSQRELVRALLDGARRGVNVRLLLDPDKDGYGYDHAGIPNRQVASELISTSDGAIRVRWYRTHGERFSPGFALIQNATRAWLMVGTSTLSRLDLGDFNLAAAAVVDVPPNAPAATDALGWFDALWYNRASSGPNTPPMRTSMPMPRSCAIGSTGCSKPWVRHLTDLRGPSLSRDRRYVDNRTSREALSLDGSQELAAKCDTKRVAIKRPSY